MKKTKGLKGVCTLLLVLVLLAALPAVPVQAADKTSQVSFDTITFSLVRGGTLYPFVTLTWDDAAQSYTLTRDVNITVSKGDEIALRVGWHVKDTSQIAVDDHFLLAFNTGGLFEFPNLASTPLEGDTSFGAWEIDGAASTIKVVFNQNAVSASQLVDGYINVRLGAVNSGNAVPVYINGSQEFELTVKQPSQGGHGPIPGSGVGEFDKFSHVYATDKKIRWVVQGYGDAVLKFYNGQPLQPLQNVVLEDTVTNGQTILPATIGIQLVVQAPYIEADGTYQGQLFSQSPAYISIHQHFTWVDGAAFGDPLAFKQHVMDNWPAYGVYDGRYLVVAFGPMNDGSVPGALRPVDIIDAATSGPAYAGYSGNGLTKLLDYYEANGGASAGIVYSSLQRQMMADAYYNTANAVNGGLMDFRVVFDADASQVPGNTEVPNVARVSNEAVIVAEIPASAQYSVTSAGVTGWYNGALTLQKIDRETGGPLEGVGFLLQRWNGSAWQYYTYSPGYTNAQGELLFTQLEDGRYKIVEVFPLPGYSGDAEYNPGAEFTIARGSPSTERISVTATNAQVPTVPSQPPEEEPPPAAKTPPGGSPQTGDTSSLPAQALLGGLALAGLLVCAFALRRAGKRNTG